MIINNGDKVMWKGQKATVVAQDYSVVPKILLKVKTGWFSSKKEWVSLFEFMQEMKRDH